METPHSILKKFFGYDSFRPGQEEIVSRLLAGQDVLAVMPTGAGKSICYQVPALLLPGITIVVSPLVSLMKDQVGALVQAGVAAAFLNNSLNDNQKALMLRRAREGWYKIIYVAPERLEMPGFQRFAQERQISMVTVDEAHCISQWGQDFRPSYLRIQAFVDSLPTRPVVGAFTATATAHVRDDIREQLALQKPYEVTTSFDRPNLYFETRRALPSQKPKELLDLVLREGDNAGIVYCSTTKQVDETARLLQSRGIRAAAYHAKLDAEVRRKNQDDFLYDRVQIMVATNAFGMGIDKPDVRVVIHYDCPNSIEAYFQEAGRAGRDGNKAYAVLLYNASDNKRLLKRIAEEYPDKDTVVKIYEHLAYYLQIAANTGYGHTFQLDVDRFARTFKHFPTIVNSALRILSRAGYIHYETDPDSRTRLRFLLDRDQLYILNDSSPDEEAVISVALREYSGMFTDYRYIDETRIAQLSGVPVNKVYLILKSLNQRRIVHFIPQRTVPLVTYTRDRELPENVVIPTSVYEDRKKLFEWHIKQMLLYAMNNNVCRSRQLLRYFGEEQTADCGKCDVCLARKNESQTDTDAKDARQKILALLSDGEWHQKTELLKIDAPKEAVSNAIRYLVLEELISIDHAKVRTK